MRTLFLIPFLLASCASPHGIVQDKVFTESHLDTHLVMAPHPNLYMPQTTMVMAYYIKPAQHHLKINGRLHKVTKAEYDRATIGGTHL